MRAADGLFDNYIGQSLNRPLTASARIRREFELAHRTLGAFERFGANRSLALGCLLSRRRCGLSISTLNFAEGSAYRKEERRRQRRRIFYLREQPPGLGSQWSQGRFGRTHNEGDYTRRLHYGNGIASRNGSAERLFQDQSHPGKPTQPARTQASIS
jgi:hypothetical protein